MRLFTAIEIPEKVRERVREFVNKLRPYAPISWAQPQNLHITTKFIGEWPDERLEEIKQVLATVPRIGPIEISIRGVGYFPNPHAPRVFWAAVHAGPQLKQLAELTESALAELGIPREQRPFSPHLTLARIKGRHNLSQLQQQVARYPSLDFGSFTADRFILFRSQLHPHGAIYTPLAEFPLE